MDSDDSDTAKAKAKAERKAARKAEKKRLAAAGEPSPKRRRRRRKKRKAQRRTTRPEEEEKGQDRGFVLRRHGDGLAARTRSVDAQDKASKEARHCSQGSKTRDFSLSSVTRQALQARGGKVLFPIQAATFSTIFDEKRDYLQGRGPGTGKTRLSSLPIIDPDR